MALIDNIDGVAKVERELTDLNNRLGKSDISGIGNGTVTGALCEVNKKIEDAIVQTTSPMLANSVAGGLKVVEVQGNTEQETTTGAQLFDIDNAAINTDYFDSNGSTLTGNTSTKVLLVEATGSTAYAVEVLANSNTQNTLKVNCLTSGKAFINRVASVATGSTTFTTPSNCAFLQIAINTSITKVMLNKGDSALAWEKYTGVKASPNPDYPQEIKCVNVGEIKTNGKNLLNARLNVNIGKTNEPYKIFNIKGGTKYTLQLQQELVEIGTNLTAQHWISFRDKNGAVVYAGQACVMHFTTVGEVQTKKQTFTAPTNAEYCIVDLSAYYGTNSSTIKTIYAQFEEGEGTDVETYQEMVVALSNPITLNGIGVAKDRIIKKDGLWQIERRFAEVDLSTLTWSRSTDNKMWYTNDLKWIGIFNYNDVTWMCNEWYAHVWSGRFNGCIACDGYKTLCCITDDSANKPKGKLIYALMDDKVTFEPLPTVDQIALNSLQAFDGATYVNADCEINPIIEVEYGTSKIGAYSLEAYSVAQRNSILIAEINKAIPYAISIDDAASTINFEDRSAV